mmetsp:Transcript_40458/g.38953  ORF Transcript_40458/g.38953 Transcript_40458/m.38953 type:complete len:254 (-) Transcript_40458:75-836(-)
MQVVSACFSSFTTLSDLNLAKNKLHTVEQDALANLRNLVMLDLHSNQFTSFSSIPKAKKLDTINLAFNFLEKIENLENAANLCVLDLHNNKLEHFPETILDLKNLKTLKVSNNDLSDINPKIALMPNLVRINIEGNSLKAIKSSMRNAGADQLKKYLRNRIDEGEVQQEEQKQAVIKNMPGAKGQFDIWDSLLREFIQGSSIDLRNKGLESISEKLWKLEHLTVVDLSTNMIAEIPSDVRLLKSLKVLRVCSN